jgi:membrane-associated phospholipid phosphatase
VNSVIPVDSAHDSAHSAPAPILPGERDGGRRTARLEIVAGGVLVLMTALGGIYFAFRPQPAAFDHWIEVTSTKGSWFTTVTALRYPFVVVLGSVFLAAVTVRRNRARALACLVAPPLALIACELLIKPWVGRSIGGSFSYPSGSTVGAAALATAAVLASPSRWRPVTAVVATLFALWMTVAVIALRWHFPSDALAGVAFGVGVVVLVDGLASEAHRSLSRTWFRRRRSSSAA